MKKTAEMTFDEWALDGRDEGMERGHFPRAEQVLQSLSPVTDGSYLDLGCGNGWASRWIHERTGAEGNVVGLDVAANMIKRAEKLSQAESGLSFRQASFESMPFGDATFDGAFSMEALYYSTDLHQALCEIRRVLRPEGVLAFCTDFFQENPYCHDWPEGLGIPMELLTEEKWCDTLRAAGFKVTRAFRCLDSRTDDPSASEATIDFRTRIGALGILAVNPIDGVTP